MLKLIILNLSKFVIACFILAAGVFGFLWLKNTEAVSYTHLRAHETV